ncbi:hypothetical protein [Streptomyces lydicus]|uniref:hypothetical protein n=1 Tax=Streptomyces lydicus TaxID=47763 RepID=UPI0037203E75
MGRRLAAAVHVQHPATREWFVLEPGDEPDEELAAEITNPDAWDGDESADETTGPDQKEAADAEPKSFGFTAATAPKPGPKPEPVPVADSVTPAPRQRRKTSDAATDA